MPYASKSSKTLWLLLSSLVAIFTLAITIAMADEAATAWVAPAKAAKVKNPVTADSSSTALGKKVYTGKCLSCHGIQGKGDGPMFKVLKKKPGDLTSAEVKAETDGALFWKVTKGKNPMPTFAKNLTDKERWNVVNYLRTLNAAK